MGQRVAACPRINKMTFEAFSSFKQIYQLLFQLLRKLQNILAMQEQYSGMFDAERSAEYPRKQLHFFNDKKQIIAQGQRHKVVFGQMQLQQKPIHEIIAPYLYKFANKTMEYAAIAKATTYQTLKTGILWVYNKFIDQVIPFAAENLPKVMFVTQKKQAQAKESSERFEVISIEESQYENIKKKSEGKRRVVVPLGTNNDQGFEQFLNKENYQISYDFPIDDDSEECALKQSFMIPSESYENICQEVEQAHAQLQLPPVLSKKAYKLQNCFIFEFEGQNTVQYDLLDSIEKCDKAEVGYLVFPEQLLRRSVADREQELDAVGKLVQGIQHEAEIEQKVVDKQLKVRVEIAQKPSKPQAQLLLN